MLAIASSVIAQKVDSTNQKVKFQVWKTIEIGGKKDKYEIVKDLKKEGCHVSDWANNIIKQESFNFSPEERKVKLALVTIDQLDFTPQNFSVDAFYKKAEEMGLKLCSPEVVFSLARNNPSVKEHDIFFIGMDPVSDSQHRGILGLYVMKNDGYRVADINKNGNYVDAMEFIDKDGNPSRDRKDKDKRIYYSIDLSITPEFMVSLSQSIVNKHKINLMWVFEIKD